MTHTPGPWHLGEKFVGIIGKRLSDQGLEIYREATAIIQRELLAASKEGERIQS